MRLSICIPTYNFGGFIGETLDSLLPQVSDEVEVVVLDGGSTDDTGDVVAVRMQHHKQLTYYHQDFRGGIDADIEKVISLAHGQYCWLFSADDIMMPGAVKKVLQAIRSHHEIYVCEHVLCSFQMKPICEYPPLNNTCGPATFDLADSQQKRKYFRMARTSEAFFSFLSIPIFRKDVWDRVKIPASFYGTCWVVAGRLLASVPDGIKVSYLSEKLLFKRGGNDSFLDRGIVNRCRIGIEAFQHIGNTIFGVDSEEAFHIRRVLRFDIPLKILLVAKLRAAQNPEVEDRAVLDRIVALHYSDPGWRNFFNRNAYKIAPVQVLAAGSWLKRQFAR